MSKIKTNNTPLIFKYKRYMFGVIGKQTFVIHLQKYVSGFLIAARNWDLYF